MPFSISRNGYGGNDNLGALIGSDFSKYKVTNPYGLEDYTPQGFGDVGIDGGQYNVRYDPSTDKYSLSDKSNDHLGSYVYNSDGKLENWTPYNTGNAKANFGMALAGALTMGFGPMLGAAAGASADGIGAGMGIGDATAGGYAGLDAASASTLGGGASFGGGASLGTGAMGAGGAGLAEGLGGGAGEAVGGAATGPGSAGWGMDLGGAGAPDAAAGVGSPVAGSGTNYLSSLGNKLGGAMTGSGPGGAMTTTDYLRLGAAGGGLLNSAFGGPKAPNMGDLISQQTNANLQTATANAELNRINQTSPWGSLNYSITGHNPDGTPIYTQTTTLSPSQQQLFDLGQKGQINNANIGLGMQGQIASMYGSPMDTSSLPGLKSSPYVDGQTTASAIKAAQDAAYKDQTQYLDPQYAQQDESLRQQLANQGLDPNSQAYKNAMLNQSQTKQRAYQSAQNSAVTAGQNEQNTLYGQGLAGANLQNQSNQLGMQNLFSLRSQPLNEYNALTSGTQVSAPNFTGFQPVAMPNVNTLGTAQGLYGLQQANSNATTSGLFSLAGAASKSNLFG